MEKVLTGTTYNRSMSIVDNVVTINHVSRLKDGDHYMSTKLDLTNMDTGDMVKHAAMNILIQIIRPRYLKQRISSQIDETKVLDPMEFPAVRGGGINKREASIRTLMELGFSKEDAEYAIDNPEKAKQALSSRIKLRKGNGNKNGKSEKDNK